MENAKLELERHIEAAAKAFIYPATPDLARRAWREKTSLWRSRRLAWPLVAGIVLLISAITVPGVRARLLEFVQVGAVRIFLVEATAAATAQESSTQAAPGAVLLTATPHTPVRQLHSVLELQGETTLGTARERVDFSIPLPSYPPDLGPPDKVFLQEISGPVVVLVWLQTGTQDEVRLSLHILGPGAFANKGGPPPVVEWAQVNGQEAVWTNGGYMLSYGGDFHEDGRFIDGPVLVWEDGELTFRLENAGSMDEATRIAESLVYEE
jgi:hypothetical protein